MAATLQATNRTGATSHPSDCSCLPAGDHVAAAAGAERAQSIAAKRLKYDDNKSPLCVGSAADKELSPVNAMIAKDVHSTVDPISHLEWIGVQRFVADRHADAAVFFSRARDLLLRRVKQTRVEKGGGLKGRAIEDLLHSGNGGVKQDDVTEVPGADCDGSGNTAAAGRRWRENKEAGIEIAQEEVDQAVMRLDRCAAVAICRQRSEAF